MTEPLAETEPQATSEPPAGSWWELDEKLTRATPEVAFLAAEIDGDECRPVHAIEPDSVLALGSAFKLYVLGAAALAVEAGDVTWDEPIAIRDELRVHSSAHHDATRAGTTVPFGDLAESMISVSDNTATDHVIGRVGRDVIEASLPVLGMADPGRNTPFLDTREASLLKWAIAAEERDHYLALDSSGRREFLHSRLPATGADLVIPPRPIAVDTLEWFASPADLCRVQVSLQGLAARPGLAVVRQIVGANPGSSAIDRDDWPYVAFKSGSEAGVVALSWYLERDDDRRFAVAALFRNGGGLVSASVAVDVAAVFGLLAGW